VAEIGLVTSMSFFIDAAVFYPIGVVMDRFGRKWVGVPCLVVLALGLLMVPFAQNLPLFCVVAMVTGFGNGLGAGIVMTLGADFSPSVNRAEFLGVWRLISDIGQTGGPAVLSALTGLASLGTASVVTGGIGLVGAVIMVLFMAEPLPKRTRIVSVDAHAPPEPASTPGG
jgi:MFS family permease